MRRASFLLVLLFTACAHVGPTVSDRLFCGRNIPGGGTVTDADLTTFIAEVVEPRFPEGFTVWRAKGQWRGGDEDVVILEFLRPNQPQLDRAVAEIAAEYRRRFRQEAVLRVTTPARMEFER